MQGKPEPKPAVPAFEAELAAMKRIGRILTELPLDGRARVVLFVAAQFGAAPAKDPS